MDWPPLQWVAMLRKPTAREVSATFLLLLPLFASLLYRLYAKIRRRDRRSAGLQILSDESNNDHVKYEIIAVHGLGASPEHTWTCKPSSKSRTSDNPQSVHLLKDLLMKDERFSDARILHFAYNSDWLVDACFESAHDIGLRLIESLIEHRKAHPRLPLIFVGHSFGGIVIKEALSSYPEDTQRILEDTCGIIFLGTPHLGSPVAGFGATLAYLTGFLGSNTGLLLLLRSNGEMLVNLSKAFQVCVKDKKEKKGRETQIVTICEKKPTYLLNWLYAGKIVPWESATFGANFADVFEVDKDHTGLNKCVSSKDPLYKELTAQLHRIQPTTPPKINTLQQAVLDRLMSVTAAEAEFHPGSDEYGRGRSECLPQTREEILKDICDWLDDSTSSQKHLYWLQGKAGTGKSTIARTIVSKMASQNRIAANFFFKRGEGDRATLKRFFTTLAAQLARRWASFAEAVQDALESDPSIPEQDPRVHFKKLIQEPIRKQRSNKLKVIIVVIDALDECNSSEDLTALVQQLTQPILQDGLSTQLLVKYFVTSRLDDHTRSVSNKIPEQICEKQELEKASSETIRRDIELYLRFNLEKIDGLLAPFTRDDPWSNPSDMGNLKKLTERASPLFEFAAAACRFIGQTTIPGEPRDLLKDILESQTSGDLDTVYESILKRRFSNSKGQYYAKIKIEFQKVVGSVISLADSVSIKCLALLIDLSEPAIRKELQHFESVLIVPKEDDNGSPIKLFHESFRDFLLGTDTNEEFKINSIKAHGILASRCHQILCRFLHEDMCKLKTPGAHRSEVADEDVNTSIPQEVQYACRFWISHVKKSQSSVKDGDDWHSFLLSHLLHWLEALSLLGRTSESLSLVKELKDTIHPSDGDQVKAFLEDAERLILSFRHIIDAAPLQLYSSVLTFAPAKSLIRETFDSYRAKWISRTPNVDSRWSPCLQTLEGHAKGACCVSFSSDGVLASADYDNIVKIWDPVSGTCLQTLSLDDKPGNTVILAFSKAGKLACRTTNSIAVWDICRDICLQKLDLKQHMKIGTGSFSGSMAFIGEEKVLLAGLRLSNVLKLELGYGCEKQSNPLFENRTIIFASDGQWAAYITVDGVEVLDMSCKVNSLPKTLGGPNLPTFPLVACFSPDNRYFAFVQCDKTIMIWDLSSTSCLNFFRHYDHIVSLAFSQDSRLLAMGCGRGWIIVWDWKDNSCHQTFAGHQRPILSLSFSPDGEWLASASSDCTVKIWDVKVYDSEEKKPYHPQARSIKLAKGGQRLATLSGYFHQSLRIELFDNFGSKCIAQSSQKAYSKIAISENSGICAAILLDGMGIEIWDVESDNCLPTHSLQGSRIDSIALSANGERFIVGIREGKIREGRVEVWESLSGKLLKELKNGPSSIITHMESTISLDGEQFAWGCYSTYGHWLHIGNLDVGVVHKLQCSAPSQLAFSQEGTRLATLKTSWEGAIWDVATGVRLRSFNREYNLAMPIWELCPSFINFDFAMDVRSPEHKKSEECLKKYYISSDGAWIMRHREKLLWILPEYRPTVAAASGSNIAIGRLSGPPFVIGFSDEGP